MSGQIVPRHAFPSLPGSLHLSGGDRGGVDLVRSHHDLPQQPGDLPRERPRLAQGGTVQPRHAAHTASHDWRRHGRVQDHHAVQAPPQLQGYQSKRTEGVSGVLDLLNKRDKIFILSWTAPKTKMIENKWHEKKSAPIVISLCGSLCR